jgi:DNA-binding transcriptional LysR family regulator
MDPTSLNTFLAVARRGSVTAAALELHTVQSNVTSRMKQLEAELDTTLFVRHSRGVTLTAAGSRLLGYAERFGALAAEARAAVRDDGTVKGNLCIGSMETTAAVRLPELLGRFHARHPEVQVELRTGTTAELLEQVLAHRVDGAFVAGPLDHPELEAEPVFDEELVLVSARDSRNVAERLARGALTAVCFRQGCAYRQRLEAAFAERGWLPFRRLELGTVEGILGCVAGDVGVSVLPRSVVEGSRMREVLRLESFAPQPLRTETLFARRRDAYLGATLRAFSGLLRRDEAMGAG